ncbi:DUF1294 domain-containing protein [Armatimonas rosea]|uniref:Uncharacterized membrane protein YsdA (DUF1294 family)/cold shock CspA family protein n=1 Tax=Armatimonas rosea TaxID=685828 RepID=A0A7W9SQI7_ARMRO|nr:DUF1294 domain-containing protein [Armatimonas rosea]MBB6050931.1 uncharacterized membrane protein YsdA (DUF1294 family)/cold shock CspA family protein [Armatimonas rosea]
MELIGKLTSWDDARGFGFIVPFPALKGNPKVFVHISAFPQGRRPVGDEMLRATVETDEQGRLRAKRVTFMATEAEPSVFRWTPQTATALGFSLLFLALLSLACNTYRLPLAIPGVYGVLSLVLFGQYHHDKKAAQASRWRVPEQQLHLLSALGGWPGALVAQQGLRHKTRKSTFQVSFGLSIALNLLLLGLFSAFFLSLSPRQQLNFYQQVRSLR